MLAAPAGAAGGDLDTTFGSDGKVLTDFGSATADQASAVVVQPDGKIVAVGFGGGEFPGPDFELARYNPDGTLDLSFGSGGTVVTDFGAWSDAYAVALQPDGRIIAAGRSGNDFALARYNGDGSLDVLFGDGGKVVTDFGLNDSASAVALQPDGKIVAGGTSNVRGSPDFALARYNVDGSLDAGFGTDGKVLTDLESSSGDGTSEVVLQSDGKIVAAGGSGNDFALARYNADGSLDAVFGDGGKVLTDFGSFDGAAAAILQPDGKLVAVGQSGSVGLNSDFALARYNPDGSLDAGFGSGGKVLTDFGSGDEGSAAVLEPDGRIVAVGGSGGFPSPDHDFALARYNADGTLDTGFGTCGKSLTDLGSSSFDAAAAAALQPDGRIIAAGSSDADGSIDFALARYLGGEVADGRAPSVVNVETTPNPAPVATAVALTASLSDEASGCSTISSAEYSLDDGASWEAMQASDGSFDSATEDVAATVGPFSSADAKQVCVRGTDAAGNIAPPLCTLLAVYDPSAGFVTGSGAIDSPPGACPVLCGNAFGRAMFGFVARYSSGATTPVGHTRFKFDAGALTFESTAYEWLVVAGASGVAQYKGTGTVNDEPDYGFLLIAYDAAMTGTGTDGFRIKITDPSGGVIYDNKTGSDDRDIAANTEPIAFGNVILHVPHR